MWHTLAFYKLDTAGAPFEAIAAVVDQIVGKSPNNNYQVQQDMIARWAYFRSVSATAARLNSPSYRRLALPRIHPIQRGSGPTYANLLTNIARFDPTGLTIPKLDELVFEAGNNGAGGNVAIGGLWLSPPGDNLNRPPGEIITIHGVATTAGIAGKWELVPIILDDVLPNGIYTIVGLDCVHPGTPAQLEFCRLAWTGGAQAGSGPPWRPGVLAVSTQTSQSWPGLWRRGAAGVLGSYVSTAPPSLEAFSGTGTALAIDVYLDIVRSSP